MKFVSWNVNGLRACLTKGFGEFFRDADADIFCLQETKLQPGQTDFAPEGYQQFWNSAVRKGYSGTAIFTKKPPLSVAYDLGIAEHGDEGRVITCEYEDFYLVTAYSPNSQAELARIDYRMRWEDDFRAWLKELDGKKPVIVCGDLNVAHNEIDLKNPKPNRGSAGFSDQERGKMTELLNSGFVDSFRFLYPEAAGAYSWWSYRYHARANNAGWRIDYFLASERIRERIADSRIRADIMGSDHCPVELILN